MDKTILKTGTDGRNHIVTLLTWDEDGTTYFQAVCEDTGFESKAYKSEAWANSIFDNQLENTSH